MLARWLVFSLSHSLISILFVSSSVDFYLFLQFWCWFLGFHVFAQCLVYLFSIFFHLLISFYRGFSWCIVYFFLSLLIFILTNLVCLLDFSIFPKEKLAHCWIIDFIFLINFLFVFSKLWTVKWLTGIVSCGNFKSEVSK